MFGLAGAHANRPIGGGLGNHLAVVVDHGHVFRGQHRHTRSHQMNQGLHLRRAHHASGKGRYHHRGLGRGPVAHEDRGLANGQMNPRRLNRVNLRDAARQFLLHRRVVTHLFHKLTGRHGRLVFQRIKAGLRGLGQALGGQVQPSFVVATGWHGNLTVGGIDHRFELARLERLKSRLLIGLGNAREHRTVSRCIHQGVNQCKRQQGQRNHHHRQRLLDHRLIQHLLDGTQWPGRRQRQCAAWCLRKVKRCRHRRVCRWQSSAAVGQRCGPAGRGGKVGGGKRSAGSGHVGVLSESDLNRHIQDFFISLEYLVANLQCGFK